jgi:GT2 family glycosyltransferase
MQLTSIIIPNNNGLSLLRACISSIEKHTPLPYEIIVVDNGSKDGSIEYCCRHEIKFISLPDNRGLPWACNLGLSIASGDALMLLHNHAVADSNWLSNLLRCLYSRDDIGIVSPVASDLSGMQKIEEPVSNNADLSAARNVPNPKKWLDTLRLDGICLLFKRELLNKVGMLDEQFSSGCYEDEDYCYRARLAGYKLRIAGDAFIFHQEVVGSKKENKESREELIKVNHQKFIDKWGVDPDTFT